VANAIRKGSKQHPRIGKSGWNGTGTCAAGAMYVGFGLKPTMHVFVRQDQLPPEVERFLKTAMYCPVPDCTNNKFSNEVLGVLVHLNDEHSWSRCQIADWIANAEPLNITEELLSIAKHADIHS